MKKITNPDFLEAVICHAANESYTNEMLANEEDVLIGNFKECKTPEEWRADKIKGWYDVVSKKLKVFGINRETEFDDISIEYIDSYYSANPGDAIDIDTIQMIRIPGGWITCVENPGGMTLGFAPYSNEFKFVTGGYGTERKDSTEQGA